MKTNPLAAVGFTLAILSLPILFVPNLRLPFSTLAVVVCLAGLVMGFRRGSGLGLAISGLIISGLIVGTAMTLRDVLSKGPRPTATDTAK